MTSGALFARALRVIPGGVNSPVRAFAAVGGTPVFIARGRGATITTVDGRVLTDYCGAWGPLIMGHARTEIVAAVRAAAAEGTSFGTCTPREVAFAELLRELVPSLAMVRLVNSGTEAVMTAVRLARGATGRRLLIKFAGGYHGHSDSMLISAGSGLLTGGISSSAGVSPQVAAETYTAPYNDLAAVEQIITAHPGEIAAIIVEPIAANMGLVLPAPGFLEGLRRLADAAGALLIFDEVITGFRLGPTTYGTLAGVTPDLTCLGKIIGGGMPIGAVGGRADLMRLLAPLGPVYQAGTLSGNPIALAAGMVTLLLLRDENPYPHIAAHGARLVSALDAIAHRSDIAFNIVQRAGMFTPFFRATPPANYTEALQSDTRAYAAFFHHMLSAGIYLPPSQFETGFISAAHTDDDIAAFVRAATDYFQTAR